MIKHFERMYLTPYYCPSNVLTIGYGHTGPDVHEGMTISEGKADALLKDDMKVFESAVKRLIEVPLTQHQFDSLVSFTFNVGSGALEESTLRRRLHAGEPVCRVFEEELPRWINGSNGPLEGLKERREAEVEHACGDSESTKQPEVIDVESSFILDAVKYYKEEEHQRHAFLALWDSLSQEAKDAFIAHYRGLAEPSKGITEAPMVRLTPFPLDVEYYYQRDSKTGHGERSCFSSSMAMALDYVDGLNAMQGDDDWYLMQVLKFGDTVSAEAQVAAAESLGFDVDFKTDGSEQDLLNQLDNDTPVPIGILHKGPVSAPSGGGHWVCLIGYDDEYFHVHDPFGQLDLIGGGYTIDNGPTAGMNQRYTRKNLMKRWLLDGSGSDGWWMKIN